MTTDTFPPVPMPVPQPHRNRAPMLVPVGLAIAALVGGTIGFALDQATESAATIAPAASAPTPAAASVEPISNEGTTVADTVIPSIAYVEVSMPARGGMQVVASGSAVMLDVDGHLVTNRHVVEAGTSFRVILSDGRTYEATVVGADVTTDLAILDIDADDLSPISNGSTDALAVGDTAIAVGSPLGLEGGPSLTVGVISAFGREVQVDTRTILYGMLQTDAAITEGSSGGALVDEHGRLIGITTAIGVSSVGVEGIGFATPVEIVARVADEIVADGTASQPGLGITGSTAYVDLDDGGEMPTGVEVRSVTPGSAAAEAGIAVGDVIMSVDGTRIDTMDELVARLRRHPAGDTVRLTVNDGTTQTTVRATLDDLAA